MFKIGDEVKVITPEYTDDVKDIYDILGWDLISSSSVGETFTIVKTVLTKGITIYYNEFGSTFIAEELVKTRREELL